MADADDELIKLARHGDRRALGSLLERHGPLVRAALQGKIAPQWRATLSEDDVMQVAYLEAVLHIDRFEPGNGAAFQAWLRRIAENNLRDAVRGLEADKRPNPAKRVT